MMFMGNAAPTLGEVKQLWGNALQMCRSTNDLECTYQGMSLFNDMLFCPNLCPCFSFCTYIKRYMAQKSTLENCFVQPGMIQAIVPMLQRLTQLCCVHYLK